MLMNNRKRSSLVRVLALLTVFTLLPVLLTGCGTAAQGGADAASAATDATQMTVYTSFYPMYDFASKIGGDKIVLHNMVPSDSEPHTWEPSPSDITALENADVFIYNGAGMEHWVEDVLASLQNKDLVVVDSSANITLLPGGHSHDDEDEDEDEHGEEESFDPHVWLGIREAKQQLLAIKDALSQADPANKDYYEANYVKYAAEFDALDQEYTDTLSALPNKEIVVSHQAFGYLCAAYGLTQVAVEGLSPDSEPEPAKMAEIIDFVKEHNVRVIFFEELASPKVAETIAKETGATTAVLNTVEGLTDEQAAAGEDYLSIMRENLAQLKEALQ